MPCWKGGRRCRPSNSRSCARGLSPPHRRPMAPTHPPRTLDPPQQSLNRLASGEWCRSPLQGPCTTANKGISSMSTISAAAVKSLRDRTNAPMMDCKAALIAANGDMEKAIEELRKKNAGIQAKKGEREMAEGRIAVFIDLAK